MEPVGALRLGGAGAHQVQDGQVDELLDEEEWKMPVVEDYCLVVAVSDYSDGNGGVFTIYGNAPQYRIAGLLATALNS